MDLNTPEFGGVRGYDAGKNVSGRKRHIEVDTLGLILAAVVPRANFHDQKGAESVFEPLGQGFGRMKVVRAD